MAVGATCAFAANPFVDVPTDSWAYKSVVELADAGIIQGVDGQYFQGNRNITRYEAAEMTAKAMAHMDKATVEQRALINKLADEYADELNNLGVRVSALENRVGNVKLTGDARIRYRYQDSYKTSVMDRQTGAVSKVSDLDKSDARKGRGAGLKNDSSWAYRVRIRANAQVNDRTKVTYGITTGDQNFNDNGPANDGNGDIYTDIAKVDYNFGSPNWNLSVGRTDSYIIGGPRAYGYNYGDIFDRAELKYQNDKFAVTAGYGKFKWNDNTYSNTRLLDGDSNGLDGVKTGYGEIEGFFGGGRMANSAVGVYYNDFTRSGGTQSGSDFADPDDLWGGYASINFGKWNALANYERVSFDNTIHTARGKDDSASVWIGKLTYGKANFATPKSWDAWVEYINAQDGAFVGKSNSWRFGQQDNIESWGVGADYTLAKNAMFQVMQSFGTNTKDGDYTDPEEMTRAQFVFVF